MSNNRILSNGLIQRLIKSINEIGYVTAKPIIVNESMVIIDGQHRFEACKQLGLPIYYEISNIDMNKAMISLNMNQQIWRLQDYVNSWAKNGIDCYQQLMDFEEKYHLGMSNAIVICRTNRLVPNDIRSGKIFVVNSKNHMIANFIINCRPYFSFYKDKCFVQSVEALYRKTSVENCNKVFSKIQPLKQQVSIVNYISFYENILNRYKKNDENRIVLI
jgi:hypothetical protein